MWSLQQSYTMPLLANGHTSGLLHGTLPRGRLDHVAATCSRYELRQAGGELEVDMMSGVKSYDHLLAGGETETHTSGSGVHQSEVSPVLYTYTGSWLTVQPVQTEDVSETEVLVPTFSPSVMMDKY